MRTGPQRQSRIRGECGGSDILQDSRSGRCRRSAKRYWRRFAQLETELPATVRRNEALPERVPAEGLVILRDGDPGEPDVTLNPRTEFYQPPGRDRSALDRAAGGGGEAALDDLVEQIAAALAPDPSLGGLAENLPRPTRGRYPCDRGAAPILTARLIVTIEYLVSDPLAA